MFENQAVKPLPIKQCNHLTKQACVTYHAKYPPCCRLFFRFLEKMKNASQGGLFSITFLITH
jgi:hypothetical protein